MRPNLHARLALCVLLTLTAGCKKDAPPAEPPASTPAAALHVSGVTLGKALAADKRIAAPGTAFGVRDTIYVSVATEGSSAGTPLLARWTYQDGQTVQETSEVIAPSGPAVTEFHISKATPWPAGSYAVEVFLSDVSAGKTEFTIR